jgi:hypothetical protein
MSVRPPDMPARTQAYPFEPLIFMGVAHNVRMHSELDA